jgi:hypothetical protein
MFSPLLLTTFAIFGAIVPSPTGQSENSPDIVPPTINAPLENIPYRQPRSEPGAERMTPYQQRDALRMRQLEGLLNSRYPRGVTENYLVMPQAPTDSSNNPDSQIYQWLPPTVHPGNRRGGTQSTNTPGTMGGLSMIPLAPTRARPDLPQSYASRSAIQEQARRLDAAREAVNPAYTPPPRSYTHTNYQPFSGGYSPYMNLFRGASGGTDNYYSLVRPELEQRRMNRTFNSDIRGLQNTTQVQGLSLRRIGQEANNFRGMNATQYFMNYGDYFQGAR